LKKLNQKKGLVAVHDAVRPLLSISSAKMAFEQAESYGTSVPVVPVNDTLREITEDHSKIIPRDHIYKIQTPQVFRYDILESAYRLPYDISFTDDAAIVERLGEKVHYYPGDPGNIKITFKEDLKVAEALIKIREG
jgi:2-C-methyl-D-erythritol 4-phosphate cytidylyltransferase